MSGGGRKRIRLRITALCAVICIMAVFTTAYGANNSNSASVNDKNVLYEKGGEAPFKVYTNKSVDLYLIAVGLYTNFQSQSVLPHADQRELYKKAKKYFSPYKNHPFIQNLGKYMHGDDAASNLLCVLLSFTELPELSKISDYSDYFTYDVPDDNSVNEFMDALKSFYNDTKAEQFFQEIEPSYAALSEYIKKNVEASKVSNLIKGMEAYAGNKTYNFDSKKVAYAIAVSFFRSTGSFYKQEIGDMVELTSIEFPYGSISSVKDDFSMSLMVSVAVHEYLHNYINKPVQDNSELITKLTAARYKCFYCSYSYNDFPWFRIVDENFVRAVEARLYKAEFGEARALKEILDPEIMYGFRQLTVLYSKLADYEKNRKTYGSFNKFVPALATEMFQKSAIPEEKSNYKIYKNETLLEMAFPPYEKGSDIMIQFNTAGDLFNLDGGFNGESKSIDFIYQNKKLNMQIGKKECTFDGAKKILKTAPEQKLINNNYLAVYLPLGELANILGSSAEIDKKQKVIHVSIK